MEQNMKNGLMVGGKMKIIQSIGPTQITLPHFKKKGHHQDW